MRAPTSTTPTPTLRERLHPLTGSDERSAAVLAELAAWLLDRSHEPGRRLVSAALHRTFAEAMTRQADRIRRGVDA